MRSAAAAAVGALFLSACQPPAADAPPPVPEKRAPETPAPKPAAPRPGRITSIDMAALFPRQQSGDVLLYDARPGFVASFGRIPGSVSWPRHDFEAKLAIHEPEIRAAKAAGRPVVVYCTDAACPDARAVAEKIAARGHDVSVLDGGFAMWKEAGLPVE